MNDNGREVFVPDFSMYSQNRLHFPSAEVLMKLAGQHVAFSPDGTRILAHGNDFDEVWKAMLAAGLNPHDAVWDQIPPPGEDTIL